MFKHILSPVCAYRNAFALALPLFLVSQARADVKLPAIFGNHMVLQQKQADKVWGKADPGEEVSVSIAGQTKSTKADADGKWMVTLEPMPAGGPHELTIKGKNTLSYSDVLVGEVWLCSGQSNMQWNLGSSFDADIESLAANLPKIRMIRVPSVGTQAPKDDFQGSWSVCTPSSARGFSGVGFFFGRQLYETLNVPVGLIDDSWGGSACEAWIRRDLLEKDDFYKPMMDRWEKIEKDLPEAQKRYEEAIAKWRKAADEAKAEGKQPPNRPGNPNDLMNGNSRPANIYNGVLKPTIGYGIKGVVWYQGESNAGRAYQYRQLFPLMIKAWREEWGIGDFSFYWVQLADFLPEKPEPGESAWAELREAQTMTMAQLPNTGQAVIIDLGEAKDIHPRNKLDVGKRLARWALAKDYGIDIPYQSPTYKSMEIKDGKAILTFDHVGGGLSAFDVNEPKGFAIAGEDKKFFWASAKIVGKDKIEVSSESVSQPAAVRYAWADNPVCNVYSRERLPLTPFRTDDWKGVTAESQ